MMKYATAVVAALFVGTSTVCAGDTTGVDKISIAFEQQKTKTARMYSDVEMDLLNKVYDAYRRYSVVEFCHEIRRGYSAVWVEDVEFDRARTHVTKIEDDAKKVFHEELDAARLYGDAVVSMKGTKVYANQCHQFLDALLQMKSADGATGYRSLTKNGF